MRPAVPGVLPGMWRGGILIQAQRVGILANEIFPVRPRGKQKEVPRLDSLNVVLSDLD